MKYTRTVLKTIEEMTVGVLTDPDIMTDKVREQIKKALSINCHLTSCYHLQVAEVQDVYGGSPETSGFYFILEGTRCGVKFFLNNNLEITRKPNKNKCEVRYTYSLYNCGSFYESFWRKYF